jgi:Flp pilus assembly CpaE family ATPase
MFAKEVLKPRDIEAALGSRIATDLPYDSFLYLKAVNEGVPIVLGAPRSPAAEQLVRLSTTAFGVDGYATPAVETAKKSRRFGFGRRN